MKRILLAGLLSSAAAFGAYAQAADQGTMKLSAAECASLWNQASPDGGPITVTARRGEGTVAVVGLGPAHPRPADVGPTPVALLRRGTRDELLVRHRHPHRCARPAVVGDARVRREPGPREHHQPPG